MRPLLLLLLFALSASSFKFGPLRLAKKVEKQPTLAQVDEGGIAQIGNRIGKLFGFLCTRCQEIITKIDEQIESQSFLEYATQFCERFVASNSLRDVCNNVVKGVLSEVYKILKRLEPNPNVCTHLRLCDACFEKNITTQRFLPLIDSTQPFINPFDLFAQMGQVVEIFYADQEAEKSNQNSQNIE